MEEKNEAENQASSLSSILHIVSSTMLEVITLLVLQRRNMVSSSEEDEDKSSELYSNLYILVSTASQSP